MSWVLAAVFLAIYLFPTIIAVNRGSRGCAVFVINLLLGWCVLGWVLALVIAVWPVRK